jgi:hypothetical protein
VSWEIDEQLDNILLFSDKSQSSKWPDASLDSLSFLNIVFGSVFNLEKIRIVLGKRCNRCSNSFSKCSLVDGELANYGSV